MEMTAQEIETVLWNRCATKLALLMRATEGDVVDGDAVRACIDPSKPMHVTRANVMLQVWGRRVA